MKPPHPARHPQETRAELQAVGPVIGPFPRGGDPFSGGDHRGMTHSGDEIALASGLDAQHAEAVLGVVQSIKDYTGEAFSGYDQADVRGAPWPSTPAPPTWWKQQHFIELGSTRVKTQVRHK